MLIKKNNRIVSDIGLWVALCRGLWLTLRHLVHWARAPVLVGLEEAGKAWPLRGVVTLRYPRERLLLPDHGRNQLHNEIDDCILCDKCARVCPVDCIEIDSIRSSELIGHTSDGTPKRLHAARFDIDMAKCCFCGLCTVVCPTECLTMRPVYEYSASEVSLHRLSFAQISDSEASMHRDKWQDFLAHKNNK